MHVHSAAQDTPPSDFPSTNAKRRSVLFLFCGNALCCACRVSNELGAGNPKTARHTSNVGLFLTLTTTTCLNVPIFFFRYVTSPLLPSVVIPCLAVSFRAPVHLLLLLLPGLFSSSVKLFDTYPLLTYPAQLLHIS